MWTRMAGADGASGSGAASGSIVKYGPASPAPTSDTPIPIWPMPSPGRRPPAQNGPTGCRRRMGRPDAGVGDGQVKRVFRLGDHRRRTVRVSTRPYPMPRRVPRLTLVKWHTGASLKVMGEFMREKPVIGVWRANHNGFALTSIVGPQARHRRRDDAPRRRGGGRKTSK